MEHAKDGKATLKQKAVHETEKLIAYTVYLTVVFAVFANYRRLVLADYDISYFNYGYVVIEALILAKVLLIGEALHLGERYAEQPLIIPTLWKSVAFGILVVAFSILEHLVKGAIHHRDVAQIAADIASKGRSEILARVLTMVVAFVPFFAFSELERVLGEGSVIGLFIHRRPSPPVAAGPAQGTSSRS